MNQCVIEPKENFVSNIPFDRNYDTEKQILGYLIVLEKKGDIEFNSQRDNCRFYTNNAGLIKIDLSLSAKGLISFSKGVDEDIVQGLKRILGRNE